MRYYFHLERGESLHLDHRGKEFPDLEGVLAHAVAMARELADGETTADWSVLIVDAHNMEVFRLSVDEAGYAR